MTFDDITSRVRKISKDTMAEVQKMNEVRQLNSNINAEKKKILSMYTEMGKKLYDKYRENPPEEFEAEFAAIKAEFEGIEVLREQVRAKKGVTLCPNCKMEVGEFERFCSNCGCKMPEVFRIVDEEPTGELETEEGAAEASGESGAAAEDAVSEAETDSEAEDAAEETMATAADTVPEAETAEADAVPEAKTAETETVPEAKTAETDAVSEAETAEADAVSEAETAEADAVSEAETAEADTVPEAETVAASEAETLEAEADMKPETDAVPEA